MSKKEYQATIICEDPSNRGITLNDYQQFALSTADPCARDPLYLACGICEEAGEAAGKVKKVLRDNHGYFNKERRQGVALELSDVLWYVANQAHQMGYTLSEIAQLNIDKINGRLERGTLHGSGDKR